MCTQAVRKQTFLIVVSLFCASACGGDPLSEREREQMGVSGSSGNGTSGDGSPGAGMSGGTFGNGSGEVPDLPDAMVGTVDPNACNSTGKTTEPGLAAVDIVWAIDGSGSMVDEAMRVQTNIDTFVNTISAAGVDTRVVLLGPMDLVPAASGLAQSGNYRFLQDDVDSHNALDRIVARYPDYQDFLRPTAHVHFIIVTDDESEYQGLGSPAERSMAFRGTADGMLETDFSLHAIVSPGRYGDPPCAPQAVPAMVVSCCQQYLLSLFLVYPAGCESVMADVTPLTCPFLGGAAANGETYEAVADATGGVKASICQDDWTGVFSSLSDAVIESAPLPCNYAIPDPPSGMVLDADKVNVKYTPTGGDPASVNPYPKVADLGACGDNLAWYFDNPTDPGEVLLCPSACDAVSAETGGTLDVLFGCATIVLE